MPSPRRVVLVVVAAVVLMGVVAFAVVDLLRDPPDDASPGSPTPTPLEPTEVSEPSTAPAPTPSPEPSEPSPTAVSPQPDPTSTLSPTTDAGGSPTAVTVTIHGWDTQQQVAELVAYADVREEGGVCTLTMTRDGVEVTASVDAIADASTTSCGSISIPRSELVPGSWQARVDYLSAQHSGRSALVTIEVP